MATKSTRPVPCSAGLQKRYQPADLRTRCNRASAAARSVRRYRVKPCLRCGNSGSVLITKDPAGRFRATCAACGRMAAQGDRKADAIRMWNGGDTAKPGERKLGLVEGRAHVSKAGEELERLRAAQSSGGRGRAMRKREAAEAWKERIRPKVFQYLAAGKTGDWIGMQLSEDAGRESKTVADFARSIAKKK